MISFKWIIALFYLGISCLACLHLTAQVDAAPVATEEDNSIYDRIEKINEKSSTELFEGDIIRSRNVIELLNKTQSKNTKRDAKRYLAALWRTRVIPYEISSDFSTIHDKNAITKALKTFEAKTCLKFTQRTTEPNWILFEKKDGCFSTVGREYWSAGSQTVSLGPGCLGQSTILHEVMHALGFWHEQSRPDRDNYVEIFWENISPDKAFNFDKYSHAHADVLGVGYDYQTIMHFGKKAFSKNGLVTMQAIGNSALELGQSASLSASDITQLNALYDCASAGVSIWSAWSAYGPCDELCYKSRHRFCSHANLTMCSTANQYGIETQYLSCSNVECNAPVDGHWGRWSSWGACTHECGQGKTNRTRQCNDPIPKHGGKACLGDSMSYKDCLIKTCGLGKYDCEFDGQGWCSWKVASSNLPKYTWSRRTGRTPSSGTGPSGDHSTSTGFYLYTEASSPASFNDKAQLISGEMPATKGVCLSFWYHMYGMTMGQLKVYVSNSDNVKQEIWSQSGDQGNQWLTSNKTIVSKTPFKVIFESINGQGYKSDIGLDDILFKERSCEKGKIEVLCGIDMKPAGCYQDSGSDRALSTFLASYRSGTNNDGSLIDWNNYQQSIEKVLCYCAKKAKVSGYKYYGIQYYGECWGGNNADFHKYGASKNCIDGQFQECSVAKDSACSGAGNINYIYELL